MASSNLSDKEKESFPGRTDDPPSSSDKLHRLCKRRLDYGVRKSSYVRFMFEAMKKIGCEVEIDKHVVCEPCSGRVLGGFDQDTKQIVLCENTIYSQGCMNDTLTHELIHAYDYCRAHLDWDNVHHLACTEIRAANLSGDCFFWKENFARLKIGWKKHQQVCVKERAIKSILCVKDITPDEARDAVEQVFDSCFNDTVPFERIPP